MKKNYILEIKINELKSPVVRKISVPSGITFRTLHDIIQIVFGWGNYHMYNFMPEDFKIEITCDFEKAELYNEYVNKEKDMKNMFDGLISEKSLFEKQVKDAEFEIIDEYMKLGSKIKYTYDFGDNWVHSIKVLEIVEDGIDDAKVLMQKGITPPDDCGGVQGYEDIKDTLLDENNKGHEEMIAWARTTGYKGVIESEEIINLRLKNPKEYFEEIDALEYDLDDVISDKY